MIEVSFALTVPALLAGDKCVTRRFWKPAHAAKFRKGVQFRALTKDRRAGGEPIGVCTVCSCREDPIARLFDDPCYLYEEWKLEGGLHHWGTAEDFLALWDAHRRETCWRLSFFPDFIVRPDLCEPRFREAVRVAGGTSGRPGATPLVTRHP